MSKTLMALRNSCGNYQTNDPLEMGKFLLQLR